MIGNAFYDERKDLLNQLILIRNMLLHILLKKVYRNCFKRLKLRKRYIYINPHNADAYENQSLYYLKIYLLEIY